MFYAMLGNKRQHLIVAFDYANERDTFVERTEFVKVKTEQVKMRVAPNVARLCYNNRRAVYDHNGVRVAYLHSLYKSASEQMPKR